MKEGGELPNEGDAVREYRAVHEDNFWSSWPREEERKVKRKGWQKPRRMKEKRVKRGKEKRRKKITKRRQSKEDVRVLFRWRPLKFSVKGKIWRVVVTCRGEDPLEKLEDLSDCLFLLRVCVWCLM